MERLFKEIKRRTRVVGVFPNETSARTLATEIALRSSEEWALRRYLTMDALETLRKPNPQLSRHRRSTDNEYNEISKQYLVVVTASKRAPFLGDYTMEYKNIYYPESKFGTFTDVDGTIAFYLRVNGLVDSESVVLDVGCGRGASAEDPTPVRRDLRILKGKVKKVIGIDIDESGEKNPCLDEFNLITEQNLWPLQDSSVDLCLCDNVLEHVEDPEAFFSECQRVIRQGGYLCIRTTNLLSYVGILSKLVPNKLSARVLSRVQDKRSEEDVFPTLYRCNTIRRVRSMLEEHGFYHCVLRI